MKKIDQCESSAVLVGLLLAGILLVMGGYRIFSYLCENGGMNVTTFLLGAAALGDIGGMFPDSDERWRDADSLHLLEQVAARLAETGWEIGNVDATVLAQAPKLAPYIPEMRRRMANAMGIDAAQVSVKATTEEHLGFTGAGEGMACHAVALLGKM